MGGGFDYEVVDPRGRALFTSDDPGIAKRWANRYCSVGYPLAVVRVEHVKHLIFTAVRRQDVAS